MALSDQALQSIKDKVHSKKFLSPEARTYLNSTKASTQKALAEVGIFRVESDKDAHYVMQSFFTQMNRCFQQSGWHIKLEPAERVLISNILQSMKAYINLVDARESKRLQANIDRAEKKLAAERMSDEACLAGTWEPGSALDKRQDKLMALLAEEHLQD